MVCSVYCSWLDAESYLTRVTKNFTEHSVASGTVLNFVDISITEVNQSNKQLSTC